LKNRLISSAPFFNPHYQQFRHQIRKAYLKGKPSLHTGLLKKLDVTFRDLKVDE
jgi:hypothetical protein